MFNSSTPFPSTPFPSTPFPSTSTPSVNSYPPGVTLPIYQPWQDTAFEMHAAALAQEYAQQAQSNVHFPQVFLPPPLPLVIPVATSQAPTTPTKLGGSISEILATFGETDNFVIDEAHKRDKSGLSKNPNLIWFF